MTVPNHAPASLGGRGPAGDRHDCAVPVCDVQIDRARLMCPPDWYRVPKPLRDAVWRTWRGGAGVLTPAYLSARRAAVDAALSARGLWQCRSCAAVCRHSEQHSCTARGRRP